MHAQRPCTSACDESKGLLHGLHVYHDVLHDVVLRDEELHDVEQLMGGQPDEQLYAQVQYDEMVSEEQ